MSSEYDKMHNEKRRWEENLLNKRPTQKHATDCGDPIEVLYTPDDLPDADYLLWL